MTRSRTASLAAMVGILLAVAPSGRAHAAARYGLHLGPPHTVANGVVAVPVRLRLPKGQAVAALNFTLHYDATQVDVAGDAVVPAPGLQRARADLFSRVEAASASVKTIVLPEFTRDFAPVRAGRIATVYVHPRGGMPKALHRWVTRNVHLDGAVLGDAEGREMHLPGREKRS